MMTSPPMKRCTKCGVEYPATAEYFFSDKTKADGLYSSCKPCRTKYKAANRIRINQYKREHRARNIEEFRQDERDYYSKHRDRIRVYMRDRRNSQIDEFRQSERDYFHKNKDRINRNSRERRAKDRDAVNKKNKEYRDKDRESYRASQRKHYANFRERNLARSRDYALRNAPRMRVIKQRHKTRKRNLPDTFTHTDWERAGQYFGGCCAYCGQQKKLSMEHYIPLSDPNCPGTVPFNILPACHSCNSSKQDTPLEMWLKRRFSEDQAANISLNIEQYFAWLQSLD